jgi:serine/threonine protein phosphatase PrpC
LFSFFLKGLADGAGGNRSLGINPADFSRAILACCRNILRQDNIQPNQLPRLILSAMQQVESSRIRGSSTLCLFALDKKENMLTSLNIGDSGFVIYRNNEIYRRSKCTMSANGCGPRQLFAINSSLGLPCFINEKSVVVVFLIEKNIFKLKFFSEVLRDCSLDTFAVQKDDIIILSSDGLWDVIKADQLQEIMERNTDKVKDFFSRLILYTLFIFYSIYKI